MRVCGRPTPPDSPKSSVKSCDKIDKPGPDTFFAPRNRLKIRNCPARKGLSGPDFSIFSQLLTLGAIWPLLESNPHRTHPHQLAVRLLAAHIVIAGLAALDHAILPDEID